MKKTQYKELEGLHGKTYRNAYRRMARRNNQEPSIHDTVDEMRANQSRPDYLANAWKELGMQS